MKRKEKDLLFAYLYNNYSRMQRTAQLNLFRQVYSDIIALLKLSKLEGEGGKNED